MAAEQNYDELDAMHERVEKLRRDLETLLTLERGAAAAKKHDAIEPPREPVMLDPDKKSRDI